MALVERQADPGLPTLDPDVPDGHPAGPSRRRTLALAAVVTVLAALVANAVLQAQLWWDVVGLPSSFLAGLVQPLDAVIVWLLLLFLVALTGRLWTGVGLLGTVTLVLVAVNTAKMSILTEPLVPSDRAFLTTPGFLVSMVPPGRLLLGVVAIVAVLVLPVLLGRRLARRWPRVTHGLLGPARWRALVVRVAVLLVTGALLFDTTRFNHDGNLWQRVYEGSGAEWRPYSQAMNYRENGFVGGLLYNMPIEPMARPAGYSRSGMQAVAEKYADRAAARNAGRDPHALDDVNVVLVLSESFADPTRLKGLDVGRDPMPRTRQHIADAWGGDALASFYGTGTSSMEFQALTGQNLALFNPQIVAPYQNFLAGMASYPSAVGWFEQAGHTPIAVHPYTTEMYRRSTVYPMLGFDEFVHDSEMQEQDKVEHNTYISDESAFDEVEYQLRTHDEPVLLNLVTMQNHVPMADWYDDPVPVSGDVDEQQAREIGGDARGMEISDAALDRFLADLRAGEREDRGGLLRRPLPGHLQRRGAGPEPRPRAAAHPAADLVERGPGAPAAAADQLQRLPALRLRPRGPGAAAVLRAAQRGPGAGRRTLPGPHRGPGRPRADRGPSSPRSSASCCTTTGWCSTTSPSASGTPSTTSGTRSTAPEESLSRSGRSGPIRPRGPPRAPTVRVMTPRRAQAT